VARVSPTDHRLTRGRARLKEGSEAHLWVAVVRVGVDGVNGGELFCGRRSSAMNGEAVLTHSKTSECVHSAPGSVLSTKTGSDASFASSVHGGLMTGGEELRSRLGVEARARAEVRGQGEKKEELTAISMASSASSGMH
jgi:hypothetical protein